MDEQDLHEAKIADIYRPGKGTADLLKVSSVIPVSGMRSLIKKFNEVIYT